jgi:aryl sulfotransferase
VPPVRYRSPDEDSGRWSGFPLRQGDIVVSTRSKHGTTWVQAICLMLILGSPELPAPLGELSPWLDWRVVPRDEVWAGLAAQRHRRVIKTHTPLDGVPIDDRATYLVVARHPLDAAVSLYHQGDNIDRERVSALTGTTRPSGDEWRAPVDEWLRAWIAHDAAPRAELDSLPGVMWHIGDAWRRRHQPNVVLVHYADLSADLDGEMRRLSRELGTDVPGREWPALVAAAGFASMRRRARDLAPDHPLGVLRDRRRFFRRGTSGEGRALLTATDLRAYRDRVGALAPADLLEWLHRDGTGGPGGQSRSRGPCED